MKKILLILLITLFFVFSCKSTPESLPQENEIPEDIRLVIEEQIEEEQIEEEQIVHAEEDIIIDEPIIEIAEEEIQEPELEEINITQTDEAIFEMEQQIIEMELLLTDMEQQILDMEQRLAELEQRLLNDDENTVAVHAPPVQDITAVQLPVQPPQAQTPVQRPLPVPPLIEEITPDVYDEIEEPAPPLMQTPLVRETPRQNIPSAPAARIETLPQMGMTPLDTEIIFSRVVRATQGQILEIPFRGNGWVFLGELASRRGIVYSSRRSDPEGQSFIFLLEEPGTYILKFYRQDFIRDYILNDHVQVIVGDAPAVGTGWFNQPSERSRVVAMPRWPSALEEAQIRSGTRITAEPVITAQEIVPAQPAPQSIQPQQPVQEPVRQQPIPPPAQSVQQQPAQPQPPVTPVPHTSVSEDSLIAAVASPALPVQPTVTEILPPDVILQRARNTFEEGNVAGAIALLDQFMVFYPSGSDEAYWLLGQFYEANSPNRNILLSLDYYRRLTNEYPQSRRFNDARRRIAYLERFYINIQ